MHMGLTAYERKICADMLADLTRQFLATPYLKRPPKPRPELPDAARASAKKNAPVFIAEQLVEFLRSKIQAETERMAALQKHRQLFEMHFTRALTDYDRREHILHFAKELGAKPHQLREDRRAFSRYFGYDAIVDRYHRRYAATERELAFCLGRLGTLAAFVVRKRSDDINSLWEEFGLEKTLKPLLIYDGDSRVRIAAFRCMSAVLSEFETQTQEGLAGADTLAFIYRAALDPDQDTWVQCEAVTLLQRISPTSLEKVLQTRLKEARGENDLFVRSRAVRVLGDNLGRMPQLAELIPLAAKDPSPLVRQALARALCGASAETVRAWLPKLARDDPVAQVRAAGIHHGLDLLRRDESADDYLRLLLEVLQREQDEFVLRVTMHVAAAGTELLAGKDAGSPFLAKWSSQLAGQLSSLAHRANGLAVRRWAAQARERIWCASDEKTHALKCLLAEKLRSLPPGKSRRLLRRSLRGYDDNSIGRVLAVLAQDDFGYDYERCWLGLRFTRGPVFRFRLWRLLHELWHPDPAKRQAFPHTIGRVSYAGLRAPSCILAEMSETKVPGEPLFMAGEGDWRPFLPLPDDFLSSLTRGWPAGPVRFYSSEGVTEVRPPGSLFSWIRAYLSLSFRFSHYAHLRNWRKSDSFPPTAYLSALNKLGFRVRFDAHANREAEQPLHHNKHQPSDDHSISHFFPGQTAVLPVLPLAAMQDVFDRFGEYFSSAYSNTLLQLMLFCLLFVAVAFGRHWYLNYTLRRARKHIPLVIGGWGTRGKSGTERLKAALMGTLGYGLFSKTTGCEAMFLHAYPFRETHALFLYRPYDKASIWEQRDVVLMADRLGTDVFLWECMGLRPSYVGVLQQDWMRDDLSTITNTYPDHENLQGPAGINIPQVMGSFIPKNAKLFTTEEQMLPVLQDCSKNRHSTICSAGWLEAGLLPPDVLNRFPYEEHPYNIALVLALAQEMKIDREFALKEMADNVVPDLGVLKTYPAATVRARRLEFSNGMSANERYGCLSNWSRLGFDRQDPVAEPGVWITTVVNNRSDRVTRTRVFANIIVNDLAADRHILIGNNLSGLMQYLRDEWKEHISEVTLWPAGEDDHRDTAKQVLEKLVRLFRQPLDMGQVRGRLQVMLAGLAESKPDATLDLSPESLEKFQADPAALRVHLAGAGFERKLIDDVCSHLSSDIEAMEDHRAIADKVDKTAHAPDRQIDNMLHEMLWKWFRKKLVVVDDYHASGDEVIDRICGETPPGFLNRIMGIQNIKGTGLDFVYRWESWDACHKACRRLWSSRAKDIELGLQELATFRDYGILGECYVAESVQRVQSLPSTQNEACQSRLQTIRAKLEFRHGKQNAGPEDSTRGLFRLPVLTAAIDYLIETIDGIHRRWAVNQIYEDLTDERISSDRAARELLSLIQRQKLGWLGIKLKET